MSVAFDHEAMLRQSAESKLAEHIDWRVIVEGRALPPRSSSRWLARKKVATWTLPCVAAFYVFVNEDAFITDARAAKQISATFGVEVSPAAVRGFRRRWRNMKVKVVFANTKQDAPLVALFRRGHEFLSAPEEGGGTRLVICGGMHTFADAKRATDSSLAITKAHVENYLGATRVQENDATRSEAEREAPRRNLVSELNPVESKKKQADLFGKE